nr:redoxin domain-containing protein [Acidobacteriota bacterium]
ISYDSTTTLKAFSDVRGITYPLLSDTGSTVIRRYNILNEQAEGRTAGIPHPGTFVIDARARVVSRSFEAAYQERASVTSIVPGTLDGHAAGKTDTPHIVVTASATDDVVAPGTRFTLMVDVAPKPRMHVYSPDQKTYIPVALTIAPNDLVRAHAPVFPASESYLFKPLNERQRVYSKAFRIVQPVTIPVTSATRERARAGGALTITGTLHYQACDDTVCYRPADVPLTWTIKLEPLAR